MLGLLFEWAVFPPSSIVLIGLLGLALYRRRAGLVLLSLTVALLWLSTTPIVAFHLVDLLQQQHPPWQQAARERERPQAIVVLAAGRRNATPDWGDTISRITLARVRYAAHLHRRTGLPVIPTGGAPGRAGGSPAGPLMQEVLREEFGVEAPLSEARSANTWENAQYTRELLAEHGIDRIVLVTQALHMPRAVRVFEAAGFTVTPAPTDYVMRPRGLSRWIPDARSLAETQLALHELVGDRWYRVRYDLTGQ